mgnify:CR=1 FL=1
MEVNIKIVENDQEKELVLSIRRIVFIEELNIPEYMEIDDNEDPQEITLEDLFSNSKFTDKKRDHINELRLLLCNEKKNELKMSKINKSIIHPIPNNCPVIK